MSLYNGPARGGNRGGKDQFNWESVKSDKDREFYLGHSVKATTGRWQKGKDVFWYTRDKQEEQAAKARLELQAIKQREEDLMNEALGLKPKSIKQGGKPKLDSQDMAKLLGRTDSEDQGQPDPNQDPDAVKGLGYAPNMMTGGGSAGREVLGGIGVDGDNAAGPSANGQAGALPGPPARMTVAQLEQQLKEQLKAAKRARKEAKKAKKAAKKAKKSKEKERQAPKSDQPESNGRHSRRHDAASDSSSSDDSDSHTRKRRRDDGLPDHDTAAHEYSRPRAAEPRHRQDSHTHQHEKLDRNNRQHHDKEAADRHRSRSPERRQRHDRTSPERTHHDKHDSRYDRHDSRHRQTEQDDRRQTVRQHRHDSPSVSPPRQRHRR